MKISQMPLGASSPHGMDAAVPAVEVADDADALARLAPTPRSARRWSMPMVIRCAPSLSNASIMRAFAEQMQVEIGQHAAVAIGIVELDRT